MNILKPPDEGAGLYDPEPVEAIANIIARSTIPLLGKIATYANICSQHIEIEDLDGLISAGGKLLIEVRTLHKMLKEIRDSIAIVRLDYKGENHG
jgi:hypothetical protein